MITNALSNRPTFALKARLLFSMPLAVLTALWAIAPAAATTFNFKGTDVGGNPTVGEYRVISADFNTNSNLFSWSSTLARNARNNRLADGGWLVISDGPDPRPFSQEYVIFYLDGNNGKVSAYDYSNTHRSHSWGSTTFLGSAPLTSTTTADGEQRTLDFSFDMSAINSRTDFGADLKGTQFTDKIGIWFHGLDGLQASYLESEELSQFSYKAQGWYDASSKETIALASHPPTSQDIPEPGMIAALGVVAVAAFKLKWQKNS